MASDEEKQEFPCSEKMSFDTKQEAKGAVLAAKWQHGSGLKAYKCQYCKLWHLATKY